MKSAITTSIPIPAFFRKKAGIGIDVVIALFIAGMEVLVIRGYKKRKNAE